MNLPENSNAIEVRPFIWTAFFLLLVIGLITFLPEDSYAQAKTYIQNNGELANPERGVYHHPDNCQERL